LGLRQHGCGPAGHHQEGRQQCQYRC
jgi:hypothetical protein